MCAYNVVENSYVLILDILCIMAGSPTHSSILLSMSTFTEYCNEISKVSSSASEIVVATRKMMQLDNKQRELVVGNDVFPLLHFSNSELVLGTRTSS